ncbi:MAG: transporter substrate-binding domain-containing protein [Clostridiales bacterium]|jgi:polar amino acid transport system substrate-binding protein|nr:transporter substrate-binding domain-containing protein [Clostridiales bacterium]
MKCIAKIAVAALSAAIIASAAGCSGGGGYVTVATNAEFPPFEYIDNSGGIVENYSGIDIAISNEIAKELGKELKVLDIDFEAVVAAAQNDRADFAAAGLTADDERSPIVDFSIPYYVAAQNIIVPDSDTAITSARDILDKRVGAAQGFTGEKVCRELGVSNLTTYKNGMQAVADLKNGKLDCVVIDSHTAVAIVARNTGLRIVTDADAFEQEFYAIAVKKGNTEMLNTINSVLERLMSDGSLDKFVVEYSNEE